MANSDKNILITPNTGQAAEPKIEFTGADNNTVTLNVQDNGTLSIEGSSGQLFSVADSMEGTLFSVSDVSGVPAIEVKDDGNINIGIYGSDSVNIKKLKMAGSNDFITATNSIESWVFTNSFSVSAQDSEPRDIYVSPDGVYVYVLGNAGDDVNWYALSIPYDISTASFIATATITGGPANETNPFGLYFRPDGTSFYVVGSGLDTVQRFTMSTPWDISTRTYSSAFSVTAQETDPQSIAFRSDGTKMYVMGASGDDVNQYALSTAWDITTSVYEKVFSVSAADSAPQGLDFNEDGTKMYVVGSTRNVIVEYQLTTPWDIGTAQLVDEVSIWNMSTFVEGGVSGIFVNESAGKAWVTGYSNDRIFELSTTTPATKLYGSKWIADPDFHFKNDIVGYKNQRLVGNLYVEGGSSEFRSNLVVSGTLTVNGLFRGEMARQSVTTAQTIDSGDDGNVIRLTGTTGQTFTCNSGIPDGHQVTFIQDGTGVITFTPGSGVTLKSKNNYRKTNGQYAAVTLLAYTTTEYYLFGDLAP